MRNVGPGARRCRRPRAPLVRPDAYLAKAVAYPLNHWEALTRFVKDGWVSLDNNLCEQQLRDIALGRNYVYPSIMWTFRADIARINAA